MNKLSVINFIYVLKYGAFFLIFNLLFDTFFTLSIFFNNMKLNLFDYVSSYSKKVLNVHCLLFKRVKI